MAQDGWKQNGQLQECRAALDLMDTPWEGSCLGSPISVLNPSELSWLWAMSLGGDKKEKTFVPCDV